MQKQLDLSYNDLKDNADKVESIGYTKQFTEEELVGLKDHLSDVVININNIEVKKKEMVSQIKRELDPLLDDKTELLQKIKTGNMFVEEECFKFIYRDENMVGYYNAHGQLVSSRPINKDEKQISIFEPMRRAQ